MFEFILIFIILVGLGYELLTANKSRSQVESGQKSKVAIYKQTMTFLWIPTVVLIVTIWNGEVSITGWGVVPNFDYRFYLGLLFLALICTYFYFSLRKVANSVELTNETKKQFADMSWIMPITKPERNWFVFGVSATAGICEELLFRGFVLAYVQSFAGIHVAVIASSFMFGLFHSYQGWNNVIRTSLVGLILAIVYLATGSIWIAVIVHFIVDAYAGLLHYKVNKETD